MRSRTAGVMGVAGTALFLIAAAVSALMFESGAYSPLNCFVTELGLFTHTYLTASPALVFNMGMALSGLLTAAFMVMYGIWKDSAPYTAASFFGLLTGLLITAQGIFTFNFGSYHYIIKAAFSISSLITCAAFIIAELRSAKGGLGLGGMILAFFAGMASAASAVFALTGGADSVTAGDLAGAARPDFLPFAAAEWAAYLLLFALFALISARTFYEGSPPDFDGSRGVRRSPANRGINI